MQINRTSFHDTNKIISEVKNTVTHLQEKGEPIDYVTFVPDGEPTLDTNLGEEINRLAQLDLKIAVISNASLIWREDVQNDLLAADWVSLKVDAFSDDVWHTINRPHKSLNHENILSGILEFTKRFNNILATETMLLHEVNDGKKELRKIAQFLAKVQPHYAYISIPTRPPAEKYVKAAKESKINLAYQLFQQHGGNAEYLIGYEGNEFSSTGNLEEDLLNITAVHPMKEEAVRKLVEKCQTTWSSVNHLIQQEKLVKLQFEGDTFYMRKLATR